MRKRTNTNPKRGPMHFRAPSRILWRVIRGMLPHKSQRGAAALEHLKVFEGIPAPYDKVIIISCEVNNLFRSRELLYHLLFAFCD